MSLLQQLEQYIPFNAQEENDKVVLLDFVCNGDNIYSRGNQIAHMTASAWVINQDHTKVLMAYHNIYDSWAWLGGHADGNDNLLEVAQKEIREESGLTNFSPVIKDIFSIEVLPVEGHIKHGQYVSSHLHMNVTYLFEADEYQEIHHKEDENQAVAWFGLEEVYTKSSEAWFVENIYKKLNQKVMQYYR